MMHLPQFTITRLVNGEARVYRVAARNAATAARIATDLANEDAQREGAR